MNESTPGAVVRLHPDDIKALAAAICDEQDRRRSARTQATDFRIDWGKCDHEVITRFFGEAGETVRRVPAGTQ